MKFKKPDLKFKSLAPKQADAMHISMVEAQFYLDKGDRVKAYEIFKKLNKQLEC
jgi:hypothetical protein